MHRLDPGTRRGWAKERQKKETRMLLTIDVMTAPVYLIGERMYVPW